MKSEANPSSTNLPPGCDEQIPGQVKEFAPCKLVQSLFFFILGFRTGRTNYGNLVLAPPCEAREGFSRAAAIPQGRLVSTFWKSFLPVFLLVLFSCSPQSFDPDPQMDLPLPVSTLFEKAVGGLSGSSYSETTALVGILANYFEGVEFPYPDVSQYRIDPSSIVDSFWNDQYGECLAGFGKVIDRAGELQSPHYAGVARILMALSLGNLTALFGDIPYRQALAGSATPNPAYDRQEDVYESIQLLLDQAMDDLKQPVSIFRPGPDDPFYGGDIQKWLRVAHTLKARYQMHLQALDPNAPAKALQSLSGGMLSPDDDLGFSPQANLWWPLSGRRMVKMDPDFMLMMAYFSDPRRAYYIRDSAGSAQPGEYFTGSGQGLPLVCFHEQEFIRAEAFLRNGDLLAAQNTLKKAIKTSINKVTLGQMNQVILDSVCGSYAVLNASFQANLEKVLTHKYLALYGQLEPWADYRRTGFPKLKANGGGVQPENPGGEIPKRLPYPLSERLYNHKLPNPVPHLQVPLWWDPN